MCVCMCERECVCVCVSECAHTCGVRFRSNSHDFPAEAPPSLHSEDHET